MNTRLHVGIIQLLLNLMLVFSLKLIRATADFKESKCFIMFSFSKLEQYYCCHQTIALQEKAVAQFQLYHYSSLIEC